MTTVCQITKPEAICFFFPDIANFPVDTVWDIRTRHGVDWIQRRRGGWLSVTTSQLQGLRVNHELGLLPVWSFCVCSLRAPVSAWVPSRLFGFLPPPINNICRWTGHNNMHLAVNVQFVLMSTPQRISLFLHCTQCSRDRLWILCLQKIKEWM